LMEQGNEPENLALLYLRRLDVKLDAIGVDIRDVKHRLSSLEFGIAGLRRDQAGQSEQHANLQSRLDSVDERLERLERRADNLPAGGRE
jgi:chromosome segregation ATPase